MPSGWQQLLDALAQRNVLPDARRWYTVRVRDFIEELLDKDLSQVTPKVEHPSAGGRLRDPHRAELARPC